MRRRAGSVRFDPYYKLQRWDGRSAAWRDVQKAHVTAEQAKDTATEPGRYRVMEVTEEGRGPTGEEFTR